MRRWGELKCRNTSITTIYPYSSAVVTLASGILYLRGIFFRSSVPGYSSFLYKIEIWGIIANLILGELA